MRRLDYALVDRGILLGIMVVLVGLGGLLALAGLLSRWIFRRDKTLLLFVGWKRLAVVVLGGVVAPLLAYWAYVNWSPWSGREYGLRHEAVRVVIEAIGLVLAVLGLTLVLAGRALRRRACDKGLILLGQRRPFWRNRQYRRTAIRGLAPILLAAVVVAATIFGGLTVQAETRAAHEVYQQGGYLSKEVERSAYRLVRERFQQQNAEWMAERAGANAE
jgi:hypothetical protein